MVFLKINCGSSLSRSKLHLILFKTALFFSTIGPLVDISNNSLSSPIDETSIFILI